MEPQDFDKMDELVIASLQELCVPPSNANFAMDTAEAAQKRPYKRQMADPSRKGACQVLGCEHPLVTAYAKKYRVCNVHVKSAEVEIHDDIQRFCQKCSRFHPTAEFDGLRRTCRIRLAQHNTRRRLIRAMQRADREASPTHSSGEDYQARRAHPRAVPHYQQQDANGPLHAPQVPSRPTAAGNNDMHAALLEVALASLGTSESLDISEHMKPSSYNPHHHAYLSPAPPPSAPPAMYQPASLPVLASIPHYHHQHHQHHAPMPSLPPAGVSQAVLNNIDPQQLVQMLQLIISLQQMGCSLEQLEHPEVLPLMMTLLQNA